MSFVDTYLDRFSGTPSCYAIRWEYEKEGATEVAYIPSLYTKDKETVRRFVDKQTKDIGIEWGDKPALAHLKGQVELGIYVIRPDSTVTCFALDYDGKDKHVSEIWGEARQQRDLFRMNGIETYIEKSRSGQGFHLWGFLEEPVDAGYLRHAIKPLIILADILTYDRMFPNQGGVTEARPYGNLIALPFAGSLVKDGKTAFYDESYATPVEDQKAFLIATQKISKSVIDGLAQKYGEYIKEVSTVKVRGGQADEGIPGLYKVIHKNFGCEWLRWCYENPEHISEPEWYAVACQFAQLEGGRDAFHEFSALDERRYSPNDCDLKFDHAIEANAPHSCQAIREMDKHGPNCNCDARFEGVYHPFDLANIPFHKLLDDIDIDGSIVQGPQGILEALQATKLVYKKGITNTYQFKLDVLDEYMDIRPSDLIIFGARPGRGKSAFMLDIATRNSLGGIPTFIMSMEMTNAQLWKRVLANIAGVNATRILKGTLNYSELKKLYKAEKLVADINMPMFVDDMVHDSWSVVDRCADLIGEHGKGIVFVDYLQMAANLPGENDYEKNSRVPRDYKRAGKALDVPFFTLAQLNRTAEDATEDSETFDTMYEGSGKIEQYADLAMMMLGPRKPGIVDRMIIQHKDRHRESFNRVPLSFNQPLMRFEDRGSWAKKMKQTNAVAKEEISF